MVKQLWLNLPVKNVAQSVTFFKSLGFSFNEDRTSEHSACMLIGETNFVVMLFSETLFSGFIQHPITDTIQSVEVLLSIDAQSQEEVNSMAQNVEKAGGIVFSKPAEIKGWMYGCGFTDLDGHRWNVLYMDYSKMTGQ